ncbi:FAD-binding protein [Candidatus Peregrinibacteria bacterium]|nr:FAD-binding protein [Candidatus Peregrinibacteria bacterium]
MEEITQHDLLIIGGGAAGLRAAIAAAEVNPDLKIGIVSKVYPTRSHTVSAEGGLAAAIKDYDSLDQHAYDTIKGSDFLADQDAVEYFVQHAKEEIMQMEHWGCPWSREKDGTLAVRAFGGMSVKRTIFAADKTGFYMIHTLFERTLKHENIKRYDEWYATKITTDQHGVTGVIAMQMKTGKLHAFSAKAIIVCTGGAGRMYRFTTNGGIKTGDGMYLAYVAGASLKDMEFIQFHPTALARNGVLITEAARGEGGYLINKDGERFLKNYLPEKMELGPRDMISRAIMSEIRAGRGFKSPYGNYIHLDLRHLGDQLIKEKLPLVREIAMEFAGIDPAKEPIPVTPAQHYTMGGIDVNLDMETSVPGLYAAGETNCISINGANRLGSNSLTDCLVFGKVAGEKAAQEISKKTSKTTAQMKTALEDEEKNIARLLEQKGSESVPAIRMTMEETMDQNAGIYRDQKALEDGLNTLLELQQKLQHVQLKDKSKIFNTELINCLELKSMLTLGEATIRCAMARKESRGSHTRSDFPDRDDKNFMIHHVVTKKDNAMSLTNAPVTITRWQPEVRKY